MQELEKILKEIDGMIERYKENPRLEVVDICYGLNQAKDIVRKHLSRENTPEITRSSRDNWIPVEKLMPEKNKTVLVCRRGGAIEVAWHDGYRWKTGFSHAEWLRDVVAWRPIPEPYRPERSNDEKE